MWRMGAMILWFDGFFWQTTMRVRLCVCARASVWVRGCALWGIAVELRVYDYFRIHGCHGVTKLRTQRQRVSQQIFALTRKFIYG